MRFEEHKALAPLTTFHLAAFAEHYVRCTTPDQVVEALSEAEHRGLEVFILGGGANLVTLPDVSGLVLHVAIDAVSAEDAGESWRITAGAGTALDSVVERAARLGFGMENLSLIPGSVGGAVVQNAGAYGLEIANCLTSCKVWDAAEKRIRTLDRAACDFSYRSSVFKRPENIGRLVILEATFEFPKAAEPNLSYKALADGWSALEPADRTPSALREIVIGIRSAKLPDPKEVGSAGSFFKNPIVNAAQARALLTTCPSMITYAVGGDRVKLAAGWLIEACGLKGAVEGSAAVSDRHALILVNRLGVEPADGRDVERLKNRIQAAVRAKFGVELEPEPIFVGR